MASAIPVLGFLRVDQPDVRLMDEWRGLERLAGLLLGHFLSRQFSQLIVEQRQELLGRPQGTVVTERRVRVDMEQWDDCLAREDFEHCRELPQAKLSLECAVF